MLAYYGGVPGLRPGDVVVPTDEVEGLVFVTSERRYAAMYASGWPKGGLYRVETIGDLVLSEEDRAQTWGCPSARVVAVLDALVVLKPSMVRRLIRDYGVPPGM